MKSSRLFLVGHPLSLHFRKQLGDSLQVPVEPVLSLVELRALKPWALWRKLRSLKVDQLYLPLEESTMLMILPMLELISLLIRSEETWLVDPSLNRRPLTRFQRLTAFFSFLKTCAATWLSVGWCHLQARILLHQKRIPLQRSPNAKEILYLKTNLMIGAKAGGSVGHVAGVINAFQDEGYPVQVVSAEKPPGLRERVQWQALPLPEGYALPFDVNYYAYHRRFVSRLKGLNPSQSAFIYQRMSVGNFSGVMLSRHYRLPLILEYNGSEVWIINNWGSPLFFKRAAQDVEDATLRHAHLIVTVSEVLREELLSKGIPPERIVVYPNCVDPEFFRPERYSVAETTELRQQWNIPEDALLITFVGTFGLWHGTEVLAQAIQAWANDSSILGHHNVHFLWVGDGLKKNAVESSLKNILPGRIHFTGLIPQLETPRYLAASDILVSPHVPNSDGSRFFGSPTKLFEYMAMGKAILASELEQIADILRPGLRVSEISESTLPTQTEALALLTKPGNVNELLQGLKILVGHPQLRETLGRNATKKALNQYTWRHHTRAILDGLEHLNPENSL